MTLKELNNLKVEARKAGYIAGENYMEEFRSFFNKNELDYVKEMGHVMEIIMFWILGMIQEGLHEKGVYFFVNTHPALDGKQIDFTVNGAKIQLKYDWSDADAETVQDALRFRNIHVINIKKAEDNVDYDIIDSLVDIMRFAGLNQQEIGDALDENLGIDAAEEIWVWYTKERRNKK